MLIEDEAVTTAEEPVSASAQAPLIQGHDQQVSDAPMTRPRQALANLLAEAGVASEEQLQQALAEGLTSGQRLGEVVLRRGWIDEAGLARLIARQWGMTFLEHSLISLDEHARSLLPPEESARLRACPFAVKGRRSIG